MNSSYPHVTRVVYMEQRCEAKILTSVWRGTSFVLTDGIRWSVWTRRAAVSILTRRGFSFLKSVFQRVSHSSSLLPGSSSMYSAATDQNSFPIFGRVCFCRTHLSPSLPPLLPSSCPVRRALGCVSESSLVTVPPDLFEPSRLIVS